MSDTGDKLSKIGNRHVCSIIELTDHFQCVGTLRTTTMSNLT